MGQYGKVKMTNLRKGVQSGKKEIFRRIQGEGGTGSYQRTRRFNKPAIFGGG